MEFGDKLKDMNMTTDEINRFTNAFKDPTFREMLHDYAKEISDPENRRKYEEEIKQLEQERGIDVHFIHPEPCRVLKTSVDGKQKCFINICSNECIGKPEFKAGRSNDGRSGQHWSLPHSLTPAREERDTKGNKFVIYDVVFHPDTLHIAGKNKRFMDMVDAIAIQAIQDGFTVKLDKNNTRVLKIKYKGIPQPSVTRKAIPEHPGRKKPAQPDPLSFPYPDEREPKTAVPNPKKCLETKVKPSQSHLKSDFDPAKDSTKPNYSLKYREQIDLQDFRYSRDSGRSPRPREIAIMVELPLLRSVGDMDLDVTERTVLLQSKKPAYRLKVPLAYPVDYDKGEAKFNKTTHQLTITLPVLPLKDLTRPFDSMAYSEKEEEDSYQAQPPEDSSTALAQGEALDQNESSTPNSSEAAADCATDPVPSAHAGNQTSSVLRDRGETGQPGGLDKDHHLNPCVKAVDQTGVANAADTQTREEEEQTNDLHLNEKFNSEPTSLTPNIVDEIRTGMTALPTMTPQPDHHHQAIGQPQLRGEKKKGERACPEGKREGLKVNTGGAGTGTEEKPTPTTAKINKRTVHFCEDVAVVPKEMLEKEERVDEDDLLTLQTFPQDCKRKPFVPPAVLRETREDGQEDVITEHATSAGFSFSNSLLYDLD